MTTPDQNPGPELAKLWRDLEPDEIPQKGDRYWNTTMCQWYTPKYPEAVYESQPMKVWQRSATEAPPVAGEWYLAYDETMRWPIVSFGTGRVIFRTSDRIEPALKHIVEAAQSQLASLRAELERELMRLAACGVVAMANTPESAREARQMLPEYQSASCDDAARAVDREMSLRAELEEAKRQRQAFCDQLSIESGRRIAAEQQLAALQQRGEQHNLSGGGSRTEKAPAETRKMGTATVTPNVSMAESESSASPAQTPSPEEKKGEQCNQSQQKNQPAHAAADLGIGSSNAAPEAVQPSPVSGSPCVICAEPITTYDSYGVGKVPGARYHWHCVRAEAATVSPPLSGQCACEKMREALKRLLQHAGIADAHAEDIDGDDHLAESAARAAIKLPCACRYEGKSAQEWASEAAFQAGQTNLAWSQCELARNERELVRAQLRSRQDWISLDPALGGRKPTAEDADENGYVIIRHQHHGPQVFKWHELTNTDYSWLPLPKFRPAQPASDSAFEEFRNDYRNFIRDMEHIPSDGITTVARYFWDRQQAALAERVKEK